MGRYYIEEDPNNPGVLIKRYIDGSYVQYNTAPIGTIEIYGGTTLPPGWLWCNGQAVSRSYYTFLFAAIGTTYGSGDGSTTFNVPTLSNFQPNMRFMIKSESTIDGHYLGIKGGGEEYADNPLGTILSYGGTTAPEGWFLCHGQALSRTEYSELFAVIGTSFGTGDGSTTFNLPDLRGEFLRGAGVNSHSGEGNGGTVGQHQDATNQINITVWAGQLCFDPELNTSAQAPDVNVNGPTYQYLQNETGHTGTQQIASMFKARPTNTSVNFIIKAKKTAVPIDLMGSIKEMTTDKYALGETKTNKVWFDGRPIYRYCINQTISTYTESGRRRVFTASLPGTLTGKPISFTGWLTIKTNTTHPATVGLTFMAGCAGAGPDNTFGYSSSAQAQAGTSALMAAFTLDNTTSYGMCTAIDVDACIEYVK